MNSLREKKNEIANFYDFEDEAKRDELLEEIRKYTERTSEDELVSEIRENFEQNNSSGIDVIYEVLNEDIKKWSNFFREEYERAFEAAKKSDNAYEILDSLSIIDFVEDEEADPKVVEEIISILESNISHQKDAIRFKAIYFLGDWIWEGNQSKYKYLIQKIVTKLNDKNWRVRYIAKLVLEDLESLPPGFDLSLIDKIRARFLSPYRI